MKNLLFAAAMSLASASLQANTLPTVILQTKANSPIWKDAFLALQKAIVTGDKALVKNFISFPFTTITPEEAADKDAINYMWLASTGGFVNEEIDNKIPFTAQDFDKHFNGLFGENERKALAGISIDELIEVGIAESTVKPSEKADETSFVRALVSFEKEQEMITIFFINGEIICDEENPDECEEFGSGVGFNFQIKGKDLFLKSLGFAG